MKTSLTHSLLISCLALVSGASTLAAPAPQGKTVLVERYDKNGNLLSVGYRSYDQNGKASDEKHFPADQAKVAREIAKQVATDSAKQAARDAAARAVYETGRASFSTRSVPKAQVGCGGCP